MMKAHIFLPFLTAAAMLAGVMAVMTTDMNNLAREKRDITKMEDIEMFMGLQELFCSDFLITTRDAEVSGVTVKDKSRP
jgi:hypothetical protein